MDNTHSVKTWETLKESILNNYNDILEADELDQYRIRVITPILWGNCDHVEIYVDYIESTEEIILHDSNYLIYNNPEFEDKSSLIDELIDKSAGYEYDERCQIVKYIVNFKSLELNLFTTRLVNLAVECVKIESTLLYLLRNKNGECKNNNNKISTN